MLHGKEVALQLRKTDKGGIPWMTIITPDRVELINADGPKGNVGCPVRDHEIDWFMHMIAKTSKRIDPAQTKILRKALEAHAKKILHGDDEDEDEDGKATKKDNKR